MESRSLRPQIESPSHTALTRPQTLTRATRSLPAKTNLFWLWKYSKFEKVQVRFNPFCSVILIVKHRTNYKVRQRGWRRRLSRKSLGADHLHSHFYLAFNAPQTLRRRRRNQPKI